MPFLVRLLYRINGAAPWLKRMVPRGLHRFVLLKFLDINKDYDVMLRENPERLFLSNEVMPWVAANCRKVLFVGTSSYTYWYERLFRPGQYTTIDWRPAEAVWGAADHIAAPVQEIARHRPAGTFDCVVLNGVFGFGTDDPASMRAVAEALHKVMAPNGYLVLGWNHDMQEDPDKLGTFDGLFRHSGEPRRTFGAETHVYDFYRRN